MCVGSRIWSLSPSVDADLQQYAAVLGWLPVTDGTDRIPPEAHGASGDQLLGVAAGGCGWILDPRKRGVRQMSRG